MLNIIESNLTDKKDNFTLATACMVLGMPDIVTPGQEEEFRFRLQIHKMFYPSDLVLPDRQDLEHLMSEAMPFRTNVQPVAFREWYWRLSYWWLLERSREMEWMDEIILPPFFTDDEIEDIVLQWGKEGDFLDSIYDKSWEHMNQIDPETYSDEEDY